MSDDQMVFKKSLSLAIVLNGKFGHFWLYQERGDYFDNFSFFINCFPNSNETWPKDV